MYAEVTERVIAELEQGRLPWVQPWDGAKAAIGLPRNAGTGRAVPYSGGCGALGLRTSATMYSASAVQIAPNAIAWARVKASP